MDQAIVKTDFQLDKKFPTFHAIRQFITVIMKALPLHQSYAKWLQVTLFSPISVPPRFKLYSHLRQYITHDLFIQVHVKTLYPSLISPLRANCILSSH
jgi:hypothetical protein